MNKKNVLLAIVIAFSVCLLASCASGVFADDVSSDLLVGRWYAESTDKSGTLLELKADGRYTYESISMGRVEESAKGKWTVKGKSLHLWDLLDDAPSAETDTFSFDFVTADSGERAIKLRITLLRTKTFVALDEPYAGNLQEESKSEKQEEKGALDGIYQNDLMTAVVKGSSVTLINGRNIEEGTLSEIKENSLKAEFSGIVYSYLYVLNGSSITLIPVENPSESIELSIR